MINEKNAHRFCSESLENIEGYAEAVADSTQVWDCHHRLGVRDGVTVTPELKEKNMYLKRPASELIFLTPSQHKKLHPDVQLKWYSTGGKTTGAKNLTFDARSKGGKKGGKAAMAKMTTEQHAKGGEKSGKKMKGKLWWNNGTIGTRAFKCPGEGWVRGSLKKGN